MEKLTADEYRNRAGANRRESFDSFERCDTDGFLSQWANDQMAIKYERLARAAEQDWMLEFPALFDLDGNLIAAKLIKVYDRYAYADVWKSGMLESDDPKSKIVKWVKESYASNPATARKNNAKKGFYVGTVRALVNVNGREMSTYRADGGFSRDVEIIDNGQA